MSCDPDKLRTFIEEVGLSYRQNSVSYIFTCPKCGKDQKLYLRKRDGRFCCWICKETEGYKGRAEYALADLAQMPLAAVKLALYGPTYAEGQAEFLHFEAGDFFGDNDEIDVDVIEIPTLKWPFNDYFPIDHHHARRGREYLEGRGIPVEVAKEYGLRYTPRNQRVVFPVELAGRLVGWQERLVVPHEVWSDEQQDIIKAQKVRSSTGIPTAHTVMFSNRIVGSDHVIVCEGPVDAIKAHLCGGNICTMGKAIGEGQVCSIRDPERLTRRDVGEIHYSGIKKVYLALDPDAANETMRLIREFSDLEVYLMQAPKPYKDLGDMSFQGVYELFRNAGRATPSTWLGFFDWK